MAEKLGRPLLKSEVVHHKNEIKSDDRRRNLELMLKRDHDAHTRRTVPQWNVGLKIHPKVSAAIKKSNRARRWKSSSKAKVSAAAKARTGLTRDLSGRFQ